MVRPRQVPALVVVLVLVAAAGWVLQRREMGEHDPRGAFHEALAELAAASALRYTTSGAGAGTAGEAAQVPPVSYEVTATGQALSTSPARDLLFVDDKLFVRPGSGGGWTTSLSAHDGPIVRDGLTPVGLALAYGDLLARTPDHRIRPGGRIDGDPVLRAATPGGDIYVSAEVPHRVRRVVPAPPVVPAAPPDDPFAAALLPEGTDRVDLEILTGEAVTRLYDDLAWRTGELVDAVDGGLQLRAGWTFAACGPEACTVEAHARPVQGRGSPVPARLRVALTVGGRPAGGCTARGLVPVGGFGRLTCTTDGEEWAAAFRRGGWPGAEVVEVRPLAFTPDGVEAVARDLRRHARAARRTPPGVEVRAAGPAGPGGRVAGSEPARAVAEVLDELGVPGASWEELVARVEGQGDRPPAATITAADVTALGRVIEDLARAERGARPLDRLHRAGVRRVVRRALGAGDRPALLDALGTLRAASDVVRMSRLAPGRDDSLWPGAQVLLDVAGDRSGGVDLRPLGLDPGAGRVLEVLYLRVDGSWQVAEVWHDAATARRDAGRTVATTELLRASAGLLGGRSLAWFRREAGLEQLYLPLDGDPTAPPRTVAGEMVRNGVHLRLRTADQDPFQVWANQQGADALGRQAAAAPALPRMDSVGQHNAALEPYRPAGGPPLAPPVCTVPPCGPTRAPRARAPRALSPRGRSPARPGPRRRRPRRRRRRRSSAARP